MAVTMRESRTERLERMATYLHPQDFTELSAVHHPPVTVKKIAAGMAVLLENVCVAEVEHHWKAARKLLRMHAPTIERLGGITPDMISDEQKETIRVLLDGLEEEHVKNASCAAYGLFLWVKQCTGSKVDKVEQDKSTCKATATSRYK